MMSSKAMGGVVVVILAIAAIFWSGLAGDPKVKALNQAIQAKSSPALKDYPYPFKVLRMEGSIAVMGTPRSPAIPVYRMISAIDPALSGKTPDNPDFIAAEKDLAKVQSEARRIVLAQPGISDVKWELDRNWLISHQIPLD